MIANFPLRACIFLTRKCYMHCDYCRIRDSRLESRELNTGEWIEAFHRLDDLGSDFNLILGNETLMLGDGLVQLVGSLGVPYALYTSAPPGLWAKWRGPLVEAGLRSLACGYDYPAFEVPLDNDMYRKSRFALEALVWARDHNVGDLQGTVTINSTNIQWLPTIINQLDSLDIWSGFNFIHYAKDEQFDFFPPRAEIEGFLQWPGVLEEIFATTSQLIGDGIKCQIPIEYLEQFYDYGKDLSWHCSVPILAVDPNGVLRCCGYRRGKETRKFSIFDLPGRWPQFLDAWCKDVKECPGCYWSYPWLNEYWLDKDPEFGKIVLQDHATQY